MYQVLPINVCFSYILWYRVLWNYNISFRHSPVWVRKGVLWENSFRLTPIVTSRHGACKGPFPRMDSKVSCEITLLLTSIVSACKGWFSCMGSKVFPWRGTIHSFPGATAHPLSGPWRRWESFRSTIRVFLLLSFSVSHYYSESFQKKLILCSLNRP